MYLQNFSEVSTRAEFGVTIYLGITMESYHIFYNLILLLKFFFLITSNLVALKRENYDTFLTIKII